MVVKNERPFFNPIPNMESLVESLDGMNISGATQDRIRRYTQVVPNGDFSVQYVTSPKKSGIQLLCTNVCRAVSCCGVIRCCGSDNYYVSVEDNGSDSDIVTPRRHRSEKINKLTNTCFFVELCNTYGKEDLPILFTWTLSCLPAGTRHYWEEWNPTSEEPLDKKKSRYI